MPEWLHSFHSLRTGAKVPLPSLFSLAAPAQAGGGGKYKTWNTWTYDKNLLLVVDYVQKYAKEVAHWIEGHGQSGSVRENITILLYNV